MMRFCTAELNLQISYCEHSGLTFLWRSTHSFINVSWCRTYRVWSYLSKVWSYLSKAVALTLAYSDTLVVRNVVQTLPNICKFKQSIFLNSKVVGRLGSNWSSYHRKPKQGISRVCMGLWSDKTWAPNFGNVTRKKLILCRRDDLRGFSKSSIKVEATFDSSGHRPSKKITDEVVI